LRRAICLGLGIRDFLPRVTAASVSCPNIRKMLADLVSR
jgi:hypothetical protein